MVEFFLTNEGVDPHLGKQGALGLPQFGFGRTPIGRSLTDARMGLRSLAQGVIDGKRFSCHWAYRQKEPCNC